MIAVQDIVERIADGRMTPGASYADMTVEQIATDYLARCAEVGICASCNNPLIDDDRDFGGQGTNVCILCACW